MGLKLSIILLSVLWIVKWAARCSHLKEASHSTHSPELNLSGVVTILLLCTLTGHAMWQECGPVKVKEEYRVHIL